MSPAPSRRLVLGCLLALLAALPARAGEADFEPADIHEHGVPYFGEAKDIKGLTPLANVRIRVQVKGTKRFFIVQTDEEGRFRRNGLGLDVDPANVEFFCDKTGFKTVEVLHRRLSGGNLSPIEIECLLERN
ncbi:MAG: hypothetical protein JO021_03300 [Alphaproteobacteria bacterium]|nr:hypothetical protein [Alphaproteobacteria bacterium]